MAFRKSNQGDHPRPAKIEVRNPEDLPHGLPRDTEPKPSDFKPNGRFAKGNGVGRIGGLNKAGDIALAKRFGFKEESASFLPYARLARHFMREDCRELARTVGGGKCGIQASAIVKFAAQQQAYAQYFHDLGAAATDPVTAKGYFDTAARFANMSRQNMLAAHEMAARSAMLRPHTEQNLFKEILGVKDASMAVHRARPTEEELAAGEREAGETQEPEEETVAKEEEAPKEDPAEDVPDFDMPTAATPPFPEDNPGDPT